MKNKFRDIVVLGGTNLFIVSIIIFLLSLIFRDNISSLFIVVFLLLIILGWISFMYSYFYLIIHAANNKKITNAQRKYIILLLAILNIFYIPYYYVGYVMKRKKWIGIVNGILNFLIIAFAFLVAFIGIILSAFKSIEITTKDGVFSVSLGSEWFCDIDNMNGYSFYCKDTIDDKSIGILDYEDRTDYDYLIDYHINEAKRVAKNKGIDLIEVVKNENLVLLESSNEKEYSVAIKLGEIKQGHPYIVIYTSKNVDDYINIFDNIKVIEGISSL